ncbi:MAG: hypothetical protein D6710_06945 [Nitrospirae bacterium]|nr:MAG: hypothetical protein D6710_06945 [Nitrospirota bacterium]
MDRELRAFLKVGLIAGAILGVTVFFLMDFLFADSLGGSWKDAVVNDLSVLFSLKLSPESPLVYLMLFFTLIVVVLFSSLLGLAFSAIYYRFFRMLNR